MAKEKKIEKAVIYRNLREIIDGEDTRSKPFPGKYYSTEVSTGAFEILRQIGDDPDIIEIVPRNALAADITRYCSEYLRGSGDYQLTAMDGKACAEYYSFVSPKVPAPKIFLWPDESGLAFTRLPWRPTEGPCETWNELLSRMPNSQAFKAWVGSLFFPDSDIQQYVWIYGEGNDGKGSINRFLSRIFGPAYVSKQPPGREARFWTHGLLGKRLCVFPDCNDTQFITSGLFKSMTGADPIPVETKGGMAFTATLNCKYLVISNDPPDISSEGSDRRRIIYCPMEPRPADAWNEGDAFERKLWSEGGYFLDSCMLAYEMSSSTSSRISSVGGELEEIIKTNEMHFEEALDFYYRIDKRKDDAKEWQNKWATGVAMQKGLNQAFKSRKMQKDFLAWLKREKGIKKKQFYVSDNKNKWLYEGLIPKFPYLISSDG